MQIRWLLCALPLALSCTKKTFTPEEIAANSARFNTFLAKSFDRYLERHPEFETYIGRKKHQHRLDDFTERGMQRDAAEFKKDLAAWKEFDPRGLNEEARVSYRVFGFLTKSELEKLEYRYHEFPVNQMSGRQSELPSLLINQHTIKSHRDARAYISRLHAFKRSFGETIQRMETAKGKGIIPPKFVFSKAIRDSENMIAGRPFRRTGELSPLYEDFRKKVASLPAKIRKTLLKEASVALLESVGPAYQNLIIYLKKLEKAAPEEGGAGRMPDGADFYRASLRRHTSTDMSPKEIHQLGLKEVARIHGEMRELMKKVKFSEDNLQAFFEHVRTSKQLQFSNDESGKQKYLARTKEIIAGMQAKLGDLFGTFPRAKLIVKPVEAYREKSAGLAFYDTPSEDGSRPGTYYINLHNMDDVPGYEMEALAYHEAVPGHHMQTAIAIEKRGLPDVRRFTWFTAYGEGWALYAERIPKEIGLYQDPYADFGRLSMELWRACRLVVDTGIHDQGWTKAQAIDYLKKNTPSPEGEIINSVERYIVWPGQATAYKIGMEKILELRQKSMTVLKERFDIREFHDEILRHGGLPLSTLETLVNEWIERKKRGTASSQRAA